jgi:hypothetical protein
MAVYICEWHVANFRLKWSKMGTPYSIQGRLEDFRGAKFRLHPRGPGSGPSGTRFGDEDVVVALHFPDYALGIISRAVSYHSDDGLLKKVRRRGRIAFVCMMGVSHRKMAPISITVRAWVKMRGFSYSLFMATGKCQAGASSPYDRPLRGHSSSNILSR